MILSAFLREFKLFSRKNTRFGLREDAEAFAVSKQIRCDASCIFLILSDKMRSLIGRTTTGEVVAGVAQLVEQRIRNAKVGCSNPLTGTTYSLKRGNKMPQQPNCRALRLFCWFLSLGY